MRSSLSLLAPAAVILLAGRYVQAIKDYTFAGCYYDDDSWYEASVDQTDANSCAAQCLTDGYTYSGYLENYTPACYCRNYFPADDFITDGDEGECPTDTYDIRVTDTSFYLVGCYEGTTYEENDADSYYSVDDPTGCFATCARDYIGVFYQNENGYYCHCAQYALEDDGTETTCGASANFIYAHTAAAQASALARRELRNRLSLAKRARSEFCPDGKTACKVPGVDSDYECIDTLADLESCGGCVYGDFTNSTAPVGQDCTASGAAWGGATCSNGQCVISACRPPLHLSKGNCVA